MAEHPQHHTAPISRQIAPPAAHGGRGLCQRESQLAVRRSRSSEVFALYIIYSYSFLFFVKKIILRVLCILRVYGM